MPRRLPALILLAAAVALAFPAAAFAADAHVAVDGSDVTGTGAIDSPFASVQKAVDTASATGGGNVYVGPGTFTGGVTLRNGVSLYGAGASETTLTVTSGTVVTIDGIGAGETVSGFTITGGTASSGAGIYCANSSPVIERNVITGNTVHSLEIGMLHRGGGIYCVNGAPVIANNLVIGNTASGYYPLGAGIATVGSSAVIRGNTVVDNVVMSDVSQAKAGGILCSGGACVVTGNIIANNEVHSRGSMGAGISLESGAHQVSGNTITGNLAACDDNRSVGAGIHMDRTSGTVTRNVVTDNVARGISAEGGGIWFDAVWDPYAPTISANIIGGNIAEATHYTAAGGGISTSEGSPRLIGNLVTGNIARGASAEGGGIRCETFWDDYVSAPLVANNVVTANRAEASSSARGGAMYFDSSAAVVRNNTIVDNHLEAESLGAGGIQAHDFWGLGFPSISNCILWGNTGAEVAGVGVTYSCVEGGARGTGNTAMNPLFAALPLDDYRLMPGSPCIDTADPATTYPTDIVGTPRPQGVGPDMGAYEFIPLVVPTPPVAVDDSYTVDEDTPLAVYGQGVLANDTAPVDAQPLTASVLIAPLHGTLTLDPSGSFTYEPAAEWSGTDTFQYAATNADGLPGVATVTITVEPVPDAPVVGTIADTSVDEGSLLAFTATATDADLPAQTLTFSLGAGAPAGATIDPDTGAFSWTPSEAQGPGSYDITVRASDGGLTGSQTFTVTVAEVATAPVLDPIADVSVDESTEVTFTASATDSDIPTQTLTFSLGTGAPAGASIDATSGAFSWTPTEAQGPGTFDIEVLVSDGSLTDSQTFTITVAEVADPVPPAAGGSSGGAVAAPADDDEPDAVVTPAPDASDDPQADEPGQDAAQDEPAADEAPADALGETADDEPGLPWWPFALVAGLAVLGIALAAARRRRSAGGAA
jgi:VCBS repeat-containing protein